LRVKDSHLVEVLIVVLDGLSELFEGLDFQVGGELVSGPLDVGEGEVVVETPGREGEGIVLVLEEDAGVLLALHLVQIAVQCAQKRFSHLVAFSKRAL